MEQIETASMPPGNQSRRLLVSELAASLVILTGITVLIGWVAYIPVLKSIMPGFISMKVNAALCFIFIGIALWLLQPKRVNKNTRLISFLFSSVVFGHQFINISRISFFIKFRTWSASFKSAGSVKHTISRKDGDKYSHLFFIDICFTADAYE